MIGAHEKLTNVLQGDCIISDDPAEVLTTVLGSCIAVCLSDRKRGIGGMNHFLLPERGGTDGATVRYGAYAMEVLINGLLKRGARRQDFEAKIFGGANMLGGIRDIGASNAAFARRFLVDEGVPCLADSLGGTSARRIRFWPVTGQVRQLLVGAPPELARTEMTAPMPKAADITLF